jgi:hypothetical protein
VSVHPEINSPIKPDIVSLPGLSPFLGRFLTIFNRSYKKWKYHNT